MKTHASAPGKLVLFGEYAVLEGGRALVAAVNRRAHGTIVSERSPGSPLIEAIYTRSKLEGGLEVDSREFFDGENKLGLGSSAAVAVVAAALATGRGDDAALELALESHRAASGGEGSGVDVAASFCGGVIAARKQPSPISPLPSRGPQFFTLFTGQSASTKDMIARVRASEKFGAWVSILEAISEDGIRAWSKGDARAFTNAVARYGRAMASLGEETGAPIVTGVISEIMRLAEAMGGAAKPSGAGGGDVAIVTGVERKQAEAVAETSGTRLLDLEIDPRGLSRSI